MKEKPTGTIASIVSYLSHGYIKKPVKKPDPSPLSPYQPTIEELQGQVRYYQDKLKQISDYPELKKLCETNTKIISFIQQLPEIVTESNQTDVRQQLVELSDLLVTERIAAASKEDPKLSLLSLVYIAELSDSAIKKLQALPDLNYLQINGTALVGLPPSFASLKLKSVHLNFNHFSEDSNYLDILAQFKENQRQATECLSFQHISLKTSTRPSLELA